ncbi:MAG: nicotinate (nicotinamide) nucleotide adenylyltransferase [Clostridiales bacterium]|nr:nicotinate (nicotinamide) nucleotide adenylyltransferase [Clostridiales bacterium]
MKIGIFGGTFDPVHKEHIAFVSYLLKEGFDKIIVVPTFIPPHKEGKKITPANHRYKMLKEAFSDKRVEVSDFEIKNEGKSYTYLTLEHFKSLYKTDELYFIVGLDMLVDFKTWKNPSRILELASLLVAIRKEEKVDDKSIEKVIEEERKYFKKTFNKDFTLISFLGENVSSTKIRLYNKLGLSIDGLTDKKVIEYIKKHNLYTGNKYFNKVKEFLPEKRLYHTAHVLETALKKVKELSLSEVEVETACVLHDIAKYIDPSTVDGFTYESDIPKSVIHSKLGAYLAKNLLGIDNSAIIDAIEYHTTAKPDMSTLAKLVFVADMISEERNYEGVELLREYYKGDLDTCFIKCLKEEYLDLKRKGWDIYVDTIKAYDYYVKEEK